MSKIIFSQRTNRHVLKKLNSNYNFESSFGSFGISKNDNTGLDNPIGITKDSFNNIYICDNSNSRIVKLDSSLNFLSSFNFSSYGKPYQILFDTNGDLYIVGIYKYVYLSIVRITTNLQFVKGNKNIYTTVKEIPLGICRAFGSNDFLISLGKKLLKVVESDEINFIIKTQVINENVTNKDNSLPPIWNTEVTKDETIIQEKKYTVKNFPVLPESYKFWRRYTESPEQISTTQFKTKHFPLLESPGHNALNSIVVYKNEVELDYDVNLDDNNDYIINQNTGEITLAKPITNTDIIKVRYKFEMLENIDYTFDIMTGKLLLSEGVSEDWNENRDIIESNYSYTNQIEEQIIIGITENNPIITGLLHHSNGDIYITQNTFSDFAKISKVNSLYQNVGDSNKISKFILGITERIDGNILIYDSSNQKIVCFSPFLNFIEDIYIDNFIKEEPPTLQSVYNYQLDFLPILNRSEKVYVNSEILSKIEYTISYALGTLTILPIEETQIQTIIGGRFYQLKKFPVKNNSEQIYINNDLRPSNSYTLNYSNGKIEFPEPSDFEIFSLNSDPTNEIQTNLICKVNDVVRFTANILPEPLQINTDYYIIEQDGTKIKISETQGGQAIILIKPIRTPALGKLIGKVYYKIQGNIKAIYYRDISITKVEYKTGLDVEDFETYNIPETSYIEIATDFPYKINEIINFKEKQFGDLPSPLQKETDYHIVNIVEKTEINPQIIKISTIQNGTPITLTSTGFGQIVYKYIGTIDKIENDAYDINSISELNI